MEENDGKHYEKTESCKAELLRSFSEPEEVVAAHRR